MRRLLLVILLTVVPCFSQQSPAAPDNSKAVKIESGTDGISRDLADDKTEHADEMRISARSL